MGARRSVPRADMRLTASCTGRGIDRFQGPIVGVQPAGVVFGQGPVQKYLDQHVGEKTRPETAIGGQYAADCGGKLQGGLGKSPRLVELRIVAEMLQQPPGDRGGFAIGVDSHGSTLFGFTRTLRSTTASQSGTAVPATK